MLGVPLRAGAAHVMQLGSIGVEQRLGQVMNQVGQVARQAGSLASLEDPNCLFAHDTPPVVLPGLVCSVSRSASAWWARSAPGSRPHLQAKFVKNEYEIAGDSAFVRYRCEIVTI